MLRVWQKADALNGKIIVCERELASELFYSCFQRMFCLA